MNYLTKEIQWVINYLQQIDGKKLIDVYKIIPFLVNQEKMPLEEILNNEFIQKIIFEMPPEEEIKK